MKRILYTLSAIAASLCVLSSCDEWEPVFTGDYGEADVYESVTMTPNTTIMELKKLYKSAPVKIQNDIVIAGQVVSEDRSGNIYKSLYIQDATSGIELKIGKSGLYNDYKLGQWVYVKCSGMTLGKYNDMLQLGFADPTGEYETSYLDVQYFIDNHIFRGKIDTPLEAKEITSADLLKEENLGCYVSLKGLKYGSNTKHSLKKEIFCLIYVDPNKDTKLSSNRIFLSDSGVNYAPISDPTWGITTWAMSKQGMINYLNSGKFDEAQVNDGSATVAEIKDKLISNASAYSVSQYFLMDTKEVQVRSSGYSRFADTEIDPAVLDGSATVDMKGILTVYKGETQFTLIDLDGVTVHK
ncbi:MAG: DUF5689 domain-containing protein [Candidatus Cryptobacteroides sp.]